MNGFKNIGIKEYFIRYGYKYGLLRGAFMCLPLAWVKDKENRKILYYHRVENFLGSYVANYSQVDPEGLEFGTCNIENPVWVYWKQGLENAPAIVKACIKSQKKFEGENLIILTDDNLEEYVKLPNYILNLVKNGNISSAAFSDLVRYSLLEHFGGTWIDSTVFLTAPIPRYIKNSDFFAFRDSFGLVENPALISSWFIHCSSNNESMHEIRNVMFAYWTKQKYVVEYLLCYIVMTIVLKKNNKLEEMPYANSDYSHLLFNMLDQKFDESKFEHIVELTQIHKLSYKLQDCVLNSENTFYSFLLKQ